MYARHTQSKCLRRTIYVDTMCKHNLFTRTMLQPPLCRSYGNADDARTLLMAVSMLSYMKARFWSQEKDEGCIPIQSRICNLILDFAAQSTRIGWCPNQRNCNSNSKYTIILQCSRKMWPYRFSM